MYSMHGIEVVLSQYMHTCRGLISQVDYRSIRDMSEAVKSIFSFDTCMIV